MPVRRLMRAAAAGGAAYLLLARPWEHWGASPEEIRAPLTPGPPQLPASERVRLAVQRRGESDYIFRYWSALGWTILTFGIYGLYVFYQLVRRMRDHNARRLELLDAATT